MIIIINACTDPGNRTRIPRSVHGLMESRGKTKSCISTYFIAIAILIIKPCTDGGNRALITAIRARIRTDSHGFMESKKMKQKMKFMCTDCGNRARIPYIRALINEKKLKDFSG